MVTGHSVDDIQRLADEFAHDLARSGKAASTIQIYMWAIRSLLTHARETGSSISRDSVARWGEHLAQHLSTQSVALAGTGVRSFFRWALDNDHIRDDRLLRAVPIAKYDKMRVPNTLTPHTLMRLEYYLQSLPDSSPPNVHELRDRALFFYVKSTAARVGEILQAKRDNFERQLVRQKGGGQKSLTAPPGVARMVRDYLRARTDKEEWLWVAINPDHSIHKLQPSGVLKIWERLGNKVGVGRFTTQQLRHTAATLLIERGHPDTVVMEFLGSRDIRSIQGYKTIVADRLARVRADLDVAY